MHKLAFQIASHSVARGWISNDDLAICCYAVERRLLSAFFFLVLSLIIVPLKKVPEAIIFLSVVLSFRQRMGGIHARNEWECLFISISMVMVSVILFGPLLEQLSLLAICALDAILIICTYFLEPSYPPQVHFDQQVIDANTTRKNILLFILVLLQIISAKWFDSLFIVYSSLGLLSVNIAVIIGKHYTKRKGKHVT